MTSSLILLSSICPVLIRIVVASRYNTWLLHITKHLLSHLFNSSATRFPPWPCAKRAWVTDGIGLQRVTVSQALNDCYVHKEEIEDAFIQRTYFIGTREHSDFQESCSISSLSNSSSSMAEALSSHARQKASAKVKSHQSDSLSPPAFLALPFVIRCTIYHCVLLPSPEYGQVLRPLRAKYPSSWGGIEEMSRVLRFNRHLFVLRSRRGAIQVFEFSFMKPLLTG